MTHPMTDELSNSICEHKHYCFEHKVTFWRGTVSPGCWACVEKSDPHVKKKEKKHAKKGKQNEKEEKNAKKEKQDGKEEEDAEA